MSLAIDHLSHSLNQLKCSPSHSSWLSDPSKQRGRNPQCLPSDDEEEEEEEKVIYSSEEEDEPIRMHRPSKLNAITTPQVNKARSMLPLPSDDEDEEDNVTLMMSKRPTTKAFQHRSAPVLSTRMSFQQDSSHSDGSSHHLGSSYFTLQEDDEDDDNEVIGQHLRRPSSSNFDAAPATFTMNQYQLQQQQMAQYQFNVQQQHQFRTQQKHQQRIATMSGMELLIQRERDIAETKRLKPKLNPGKVKIEGLLGRLPETGSHNINFQHIQQQQQAMSPHKVKRSQQYGYSNTMIPQPPPMGYSNPSMYDYYTHGRSSVPPIETSSMMYLQHPQSLYQLPTYNNHHMVPSALQQHDRPTSGYAQHSRKRSPGNSPPIIGKNMSMNIPFDS